MDRLRSTWLFVVAIAVTEALAWAVARSGGGSSLADASVLGPIVFVVAAIVLYLFPAKCSWHEHWAGSFSSMLPELGRN